MAISKSAIAKSSAASTSIPTRKTTARSGGGLDGSSCSAPNGRFDTVTIWTALYGCLNNMMYSYRYHRQKSTALVSCSTKRAEKFRASNANCKVRAVDYFLHK